MKLGNPNRTGTHTPYPGAKTYILHYYESENAVYIYDPDFSEPMIKYGPINNLTQLEVNVIARKAARYMHSLEKDTERLKNEGFVFLQAPHWQAAPAKPKEKAKSAEAKSERSKPKWL